MGRSGPPGPQWARPRAVLTEAALLDPARSLGSKKVDGYMFLLQETTCYTAPAFDGRPACRPGRHGCLALLVCGIDCFGPITVKKMRKSEKRYGCLITCLATRAVHIEVAHSLDTDSLIMALRRMIARRGRPSQIFSDNGTNLKAGERELCLCLQELNQVQLADTLSQEGVDWRFTPPASPHFGGSWERLLRSTKRALHAVLEDHTVTDEMLLTVMAEVEGLLNSRPLTHISTDPDDYAALSPNHFLLGSASLNLPPRDFR